MEGRRLEGDVLLYGCVDGDAVVVLCDGVSGGCVSFAELVGIVIVTAGAGVWFLLSSVSRCVRSSNVPIAVLHIAILLFCTLSSSYHLLNHLLYPGNFGKYVLRTERTPVSLVRAAHTLFRSLASFRHRRRPSQHPLPGVQLIVGVRTVAAGVLPW
jgi:hypothetical protein